MSKTGDDGDQPKGNTKRPIQSKRWVFTYNNYKENDILFLLELFKEKDISYIFGEEIGDQGTPHLQGYIESPKRIRPSELGLSKKMHWERARGNHYENVTYCSKGKVIYRSKDMRDLWCIKELYKWQQDIIDLMLTEPDGRSVFWYWDTKGGTGKSAFCRYMWVRFGIPTIQGGNYADIINIIFNLDMHKVRMVLIDIPRNKGNRISYSALECICNGMITNTKFETGVKVFNPPHIVVFSNLQPDCSKLSDDRWKIYELNKYDLFMRS